MSRHAEIRALKRWCIGGLAAATVLGLLVLSAASGASAQAAHPCAAPAREQAHRLLEFHAGPDDRMTIDKPAKALAPIRNPANRSQRLEVLEIWGRIYKGRYRMRLIYAQLRSECVLMGQEVLEYADL